MVKGGVLGEMVAASGGGGSKKMVGDGGYWRPRVCRDCERCRLKKEALL